MLYRLSFMRAKKSGRTLIAFLALLLTAALAAGCGSESDNAANASSSAPSSVAPSSSPAASSATPEASAPAADAAFPLTVTDELGHELTLPTAPVRIFAPYMEDSLVVLGVKPIAQWANNGQPLAYLQDKLSDVPLLDFAAGLPSAESVMALKPDLIVLQNAYYAENGVYEQYSKIAPTYVFQSSSGDLNNSVSKLGELIGKKAEAEAGLQAYRKKADDAKAALAPITDGKIALVIRFNSRGMFLMGGVYGGFVLSEELGIAKSKLVETENSVDLSLELVPDIDADYIFLVNDTANSGAEFYDQLTSSEIWKGVAAVKAGQVYDVDDTYWLGGGLVAYGKMIDDVLKVLAP